LYVNDLYAAILRSNTYLFADDTGLVNCNNNLKTIEKHLNQDLRSLINGFVLVVYLWMWPKLKWCFFIIIGKK